jgi:lysophospholipase L1-like esterase
MLRKRSLFSLFVAGLTAAFSVLPVPASAATAPTTQPSSDPIICGLWSGSNFDISGECPAPPKPKSNPWKPGNSPGAYVALGDSVAAGLGLPADQNSGVCQRSSQGYPNLVAASINRPLVNVSCSGATFGDLSTSQSVDGPNVDAQLDQAFANGKPGLITITAGANDVHWADFIRACYVSNCVTAVNNTAAKAAVLALRAKMQYVLSDIYIRSNGNPPRVLITGYYNPFSINCQNQQQQITRPELDWLSKQQFNLNITLRETGKKFSFVRYVPVNFGGHDICSSDPWVQGLDDTAPFHPTAVGQQAIARTVAARAAN